MVDKITNTLEWESYFGLITGSIEPHGGANVWSPDGGFHPLTRNHNQDNRQLKDEKLQTGKQKSVVFTSREQENLMKQSVKKFMEKLSV